MAIDAPLLLERARTAREVAGHARRRSQELRSLLEAWRAGAVVARCAWCRRYRVRDSWLAAETARPGRTTHTICDDCVADLRATGRSA